jgi:pimeloyl-ACP methyl ester carboxylesterase
MPWKHSEESAGLCLFLHGLNASPRQWESYTRRFSRQFPETHYLAPYIVLAGNCPLEEAAGPVVQIVENYLQKFPGKPVTLVGTSNGARIALHVEAALNPDLVKANSRLLVISIAGVLGGTKLMDLAQRICCRRFLTHHGHIKRDFSFNNRHSVQRVSALQERQQLWEQNKVDADHYFFATTEDEQVRTLSSSLPYLPSTPAAHYQVVSGHTHETIVDGLHATFLELQAKND